MQPSRSFRWVVVTLPSAASCEFPSLKPSQPAEAFVLKHTLKYLLTL